MGGTSIEGETMTEVVLDGPRRPLETVRANIEGRGGRGNQLKQLRERPIPIAISGLPRVRHMCQLHPRPQNRFSARHRTPATSDKLPSRP